MENNNNVRKNDLDKKEFVCKPTKSMYTIVNYERLRRVSYGTKIGLSMETKGVPLCNTNSVSHRVF